jgi:MFS family permease
MSVSQTPQKPLPKAHDGLWAPGRRSLIVGLVLTITLVAFEALAVSTVMPIVADELNGIELYGWVFTAFMLGSLIGIVLVGGLIDRRGLGGPFAAGIGLFAAGLIVGGLAPSMEVLVGARFVQGLGAGTVPPIAYVAIGRSLPEHLRPQMFATLSTAWILPGVIGPALAGIVGETLGWRWVFLGLLPLIVLSASIAFPAIRTIGPDPNDAPNAATLRDRAPLAILVALGTGLLLAGLTSGEPILLVCWGSAARSSVSSRFAG